MFLRLCTFLRSLRSCILPLLIAFLFPAAFTAAQEAEAQQPQAETQQQQTPESESHQPQVVVRGRSGTLERLPPRPQQSPEERAKTIAELRELYGQERQLWPAPLVDEGVEWIELGLLPREVESPTENRLTLEKIELGKQFFFDPRLSQSGQIACASCHDPDLHWADGRTTAFGHARRPLKRNTPSIMNASLAASQFWDGRAASLEEQAKQVLLNPQEMRSSAEHLQKLVEETPSYRTRLQAAFTTAEPGIEEIAASIASFERTIVAGRSPFDAYLSGRQDALSDEAVAGLHIFRTAARCMNCHHGPTFSDGKFHNLGLSYYGRSLEDRGRYEISKSAADVGSFRTPSLRNVSNTAPYMHNGLFPLRGVLNLYNAGMPTLLPKSEQESDPLFPHEKSPHLRPLGLNPQDLSDLAAFLESLAEPRRRVRPPALPGLYEEGAP